MSKLYKLLIVDDEESIRKMLLQFFSSPRMSKIIDPEIKVCSNGAEAWSHISSGNMLDIVVSDINMPELDGFELTKKIKATYPEIKVVLITGLPTQEQIQQVKAVGADGFFAKPFDIAALAEATEKLLPE